MSRISIASSTFALASVLLASGCDSGSAPPVADEAASPAVTAQPAAPQPPVAPTPRVSPPSIDFDSSIPEGDPIAAALEVKDPYQRIIGLAELLSTLGPEGVPSARALLSGLNDGRHEFEVAECSLLIRYWSRHEPEVAARWTLFRSPRGYRSAIVVPAVSAWAYDDPETAAPVVKEYTALPGLHTELAEVAMVQGWFDSGKPGLVEYIRDMGPSHARQRLLQVYASRLADTKGSDATIEWVEGLTDDGTRFKLAAFRQTGKALARRDPKAAAAWCDGGACSGPYGDGVRGMIAQHWGWLEGRAAMDWVAGMPPVAERDQAAKQAFRGWWPTDREEFRAWANALEKDGVPEWFQPAIELYVSGLARFGHPDDAMRWVSYIEDDTTRERSLLNAARLWRRQDETAAEAWLVDSSLTPEQLEKIRNPVAGRGFRSEPEDPS